MKPALLIVIFYLLRNEVIAKRQEEIDGERNDSELRLPVLKPDPWDTIVIDPAIRPPIDENPDPNPDFPPITPRTKPPSWTMTQTIPTFFTWPQPVTAITWRTEETKYPTWAPITPRTEIWDPRTDEPKTITRETRTPTWIPITTTERPYTRPPITETRPTWVPITVTERPYTWPPITETRPTWVPITVTERPYTWPPITETRPTWVPITVTERPYTWPPITETRPPYTMPPTRPPTTVSSYTEPHFTIYPPYYDCYSNIQQLQSKIKEQSVQIYKLSEQFSNFFAFFKKCRCNKGRSREDAPVAEAGGQNIPVKGGAGRSDTGDIDLNWVLDHVDEIIPLINLYEEKRGKKSSDGKEGDQPSQTSNDAIGYKKCGCDACNNYYINLVV